MLRVVRVLGFCSLGEKQFLQLAEEELQRLVAIAEKYQEKELDVNHGHNMLSIRKGAHTVVVNTQTPNRQLWYSSTLSGPQRYNWEVQDWINGKQQQLARVFEDDIKAMLS